MKGIIAEIKGNEAVLIDKNGSFIIIRNKNYTVGQRVVHTQINYAKYCVIAASFLILCFACVGGYDMYYTPVSYATMDINPSLRLDINCFDRVIQVTALNDDAQTLLSSKQISKGDVKVCLDSILSGCEQLGYLNPQNNQMEIDVVAQKDAIIKEIEQNLQTYTTHNVEVTIRRAQQEEQKQAEALGISIGKLKALVNYTQVHGGSVADNAQILSDKSLNEIRNNTKDKDVTNKPKSKNEENQPQKDKQPSTNIEKEEKENKSKTKNEENQKENFPVKENKKQEDKAEKKSVPKNTEKPEKKENKSDKE